ncbi:MAG: hypothetical protein KAF91_25910 [Nostoc sp. TH1S01]|nr:hypothetical protein [Nostoc sp. TH1S01]
MKLLNNLLTVVYSPAVLLSAAFLGAVPTSAANLAPTNTSRIANSPITIKDTKNNSVQNDGLKKFPTNIKLAQATTTIIIEAESMTRSVYRLESIAAASGGRVISLAGGSASETGTATTSFNGTAGTYNVVVGYYDENDGVASMSVKIKGNQVDSWSLNQQLGSNYVTTGNLVERTVATGITLNPGDVIEIQGTDNKGEYARVDYINIVPTAAPTTSSSTSINSQSTPLDHLRAAPKPVFKQGNTLLPLGQAHCGLSKETYLELSNYWGYGLPIQTNDFTTVVRANPGRYKLTAGVGGVYRFYDNYDGRYPELPKLPPNTWLRDNNGNIILVGGRPIVSPAAPNEAFQIIGDYYGQQLGQLETSAGQPIDIVANEGETGLWVPGDNDPEQYYGRDPVVKTDFNNSGLGDWFAYLARNKARQEGALKERLFSHLQSRPTYLWYQEQYGTERGRWAGWPWYIFMYEYFLDPSQKPTVSNYTAPEMYHNFHNSGWTGIHYNSTVPWDALTQALNNMSGAISLGQKFAYPWVSMGSEGEVPISEPDRFMGMMKSYYTAGAIGSVSAYFVCSGPIWESLYHNKPVGTTTPTLIQQLQVQGYVHALFSHLEDYLRNGDLLPGPNLHPYKSSTKILPAMEFTAENETQQVAGLWGPVTIPKVRVLARKIVGEDRWLVSAWANVGEDRDIRVKIDNKLGTLTLRARKAGSVYVVKLVNGLPQITLIDSDAMNPTKNMTTSTVF